MGSPWNTLLSAILFVAALLCTNVTCEADDALVVVAPASVDANPETGTTAQVSAYASFSGGDSLVSYTWSTTADAPAPVTWSVNGTNGAQNATATFTQAGTYTLTCTMSVPGGLSVLSSVPVTVAQTLSSVSPPDAFLSITRTIPFIGLDQFGLPMETPPTISWAVSGGGSITDDGVFTADSTSTGLFVVTATCMTVNPDGSPNIQTQTANIQVTQQTIEQAQRALQERFMAATGTPLTWPTGPNGEPAPDMPPDGFYDGPLVSPLGNTTQDPNYAAILVNDLAGKTAETSEHFIAQSIGGLEGASSVMALSSTFLEGHQIDLTTYPEILNLICIQINSMTTARAGVTAYSAGTLGVNANEQVQIQNNAVGFNPISGGGSVSVDINGVGIPAIPPASFPITTDDTVSTVWDEASLYYGIGLPYVSNTSPATPMPAFAGNAPPIIDEVEFGNANNANTGNNSYFQFAVGCSMYQNSIYLVSDLSGSANLTATCYLMLSSISEGITYGSANPNAPVPCDSQFHQWLTQPTGSLWTTPIIPHGPMPFIDIPPNYLGTGTAIAGFSFVQAAVLVSGQFTQAIVTNDVVTPPQTRPNMASCPKSSTASGGTASPPGSTTSGSIIDNTSLSHMHTAIDYQGTSGSSGCSSCGGGAPGSAGSLPEFTLNRIHRYRDFDRRGSFGPGVFCNYDIAVTAYAGDSTIEYWDPQARYSTTLTETVAVAPPLPPVIGPPLPGGGPILPPPPPSPTGSFVDTARGTVKSFQLYDGTGATTGIMASAQKAIMTTFDGDTYTFEFFPAETGTTSTYAGRLSAIADRYGNTIRLTYQDPATATDAALANDRGRLWRIATVTDAYQRTASFTYAQVDGYWVVQSVAVPNGSTISYTYHGNQLIGLTGISYPDGSASTFSTAYDATHQWHTVTFNDAGSDTVHRRKTISLTPTAWISQNGSVVINQVPNCLTQVVNGAGELAYRSITKSNGPVFTNYVYEGGGTGSAGSMLGLETINGVPSATYRATRFDLSQDPSTYTWQLVARSSTDALARPTQTVDAAGRATVNQYGAGGAITQTTQYSDNGQKSFATESTTYNSFQQPLTHTDRLGRVTTSTYDAVGNLLSKTVAVGFPETATWRWSYNSRGQPLTATDANGNVTRYFYDETPGDNDFHRLVAVVEPKDAPTDAANPTKTFHYDAAGRLLTSTDESGRTATYSYDARNRTSQILYADGSSETFTYATDQVDANLLVQKRDRNGNLTALTYDGNGRTTGETIAPSAGMPILGTKQWAYIAGTSLVSSMTDNGNTTAYGFDYQQRQISTTRFPTAGTALTATTVYDGTNRVAYTQDEYGRRTFLVYDTNDQVVRIVRELIPQAITLPPGYDTTSPFLQNLTRVLPANPPYTIVDSSFDIEAQLVATIDERGYRSTREYDQQGRVVALVQGSTNATVDPPSPGTPIQQGTTIVGYTPPDPSWFRMDAARTVYQYDPQGNRIGVIKPRAFTRTVPLVPNTAYWTNDPISYLSQTPDTTFTLVDPSFATRTIYTGRNLVAATIDAPATPESATVSYSYTPTGKKQSETDARNANWVTTYTYYPCCDRLYQVIDPLGMITTYVYDPNGNVTSALDPNAVGQSTTYDARNRPLMVTTTANETTTYTYDDNLTDGIGLDGQYSGLLGGLGFGPGAAGSAVAVTNPAGETSIAVRDGLGRLVRSLDGNGNATNRTYDTVLANGLVATTTSDALGHTMAVHSDAAGRGRERVDAEGNVSLAGFSPNGNQLSARDANGVGWTVADDTTAALAGYDACNRLLLMADTHGDTQQSVYDTDGNVTIATDALGHATTNTYDHRDRKVSVLDRVGGTTTYAYDANSHLLSIVDADGGTTTYTFDARNLLATEQFPQNAAHQSTVRTYAYDPGKRLQSRTVTTMPAMTPALNEVTTYSYDLANRLLGRAYSDGTGNDTFAYDHASRLITATSGRYAITVARSYTGNTPSERAGRLTSETVTISGWNAGTYTTAYAYDAANRTTQITYPSGDAVTRTYTARNLLSSVLFDNATVATRQYDVGGRLSTTTLGNGLSESRGYRSDASGVDNILTSMAIPGVTNFAYLADPNKRTTSETNGQLPAQTQNFSAYDNENRLTAWSRNDGSSQTWALSPVGDWQQTTINGTAQSRTHDAVHETTNVSGTLSQPTYDGKGNLTTNLNGAQYTWDMENRLATATIADSASGAQGTAWYRYDALGRRIQKSAYRTATTFIHDGAQVIDEFDAPVSRPSSAANQHGSGAGQPAGGDPLADQGSSVTHIDAQPWSSPIPSGFMGDFGQVYGALDNGQTYGWSSDQSANAVTRGVEIALPQFDSFIQFGTQSPAPSATWSIGNLQPGTYAVVAVFGDAASTNQTNDVSIQGISEIDQTPAQSDNSGYPLGNFDGYAETVTVTDYGTITIAALPTAFNPKLCFVEIGPVGSAITAADRANLAALVAQANAATQQTQAIQKKQPSPRLYSFGSYVDEPLMMKAGGSKFYFASNHLYSVAALTDSTGTVVERYKYDAYGRQGIMNTDGTVSYSPSDYGNFVGFTGRYHDWETGLIYFRARYMDTGLGRFIERDPKGYVDGSGLYSAYYAPNGIDPKGLYLIAIDGTDSETYLGKFKTDAEKAAHSSVLRFQMDYESGGSIYYNGPNDSITGWDSSSIESKAMAGLMAYMSSHHDEPIDLIGHSRGGYIVMQIAYRLKHLPCPLKVRFMGLYDAVDSNMSNYGGENGISDNVENAASAVADPAANSRPYFQRVGHYADDPTKTNFVMEDFFATHSGIGGAPWDGDHPSSPPRDSSGRRVDRIPYITKEQDIEGAKKADDFIRQRARAAGVRLK